MKWYHHDITYFVAFSSFSILINVRFECQIRTREMYNLQNYSRKNKVNMTSSYKDIDSAEMYYKYSHIND